MTIAVCGSLVFHKEMRLVQAQLEALGHKVFVPKSLDLIEQQGFVKPKTVKERLVAEAKYDFIREHFKKIEKADGVLVVNPTHHDIDGYIGGNTFLEIGIAFYLGKKIYFQFDIPKMGYELELASMHPIVIRGDLSKIEV